jgi:prepilin peptidase CpaA
MVNILMTVSILLVAILPAILIAAAFFDLTTFTIPNMLPAAMFALFAAFLLATTLNGHSLTWGETWPHLLAGAVALVAGMALFGAGWVGGGDAKLFAMACLWLGWDSMFEYTLVASLLGGVLTISLLTLRRLPLPSLLAAQPWLVRLADRDSGVPYGVALAIAALVVLPDTELFRIAATS